ncbi:MULTISPECIES: hypothetical protein [Streptomyces]|uniref:Uncharacterized protein n=1 Tax=Streptomyces koelreuteriae TaxID=2838015 RepID=A0ABX8FN94_9ACTN|nr:MULTISPECIES: hypothetical protein [Streptomyces]QWB22545.1 hypothetical protein KJK29_08105 [Streptomyces koelreuteriae]UUA05492.1 hypothetical protein NNW98_08145 [Streptomyces koelreuteriae]UUA13118.1 hypothetical protein NNW99_08145 [Streptomyces sp. CRCS-T-1]
MPRIGGAYLCRRTRGRRPPGAGMAAQVEAAATDLGPPVDGGHVAR